MRQKSISDFFSTTSNIFVPFLQLINLNTESVKMSMSSKLSQKWHSIITKNIEDYSLTTI